MGQYVRRRGLIDRKGRRVNVTERGAVIPQVDEQRKAAIAAVVRAGVARCA